MKRNFLNRLLWFRRRTTLLLAFACVAAIAGLIWQRSRERARFFESVALQNAERYSAAISEFRSLYSSEVAQPAAASGIPVTHDYKAKKGAIPLPATFSILLGEKLGEGNGHGHTRIYSPYPFPWRRKTGGLRDDFDRAAWESLNRQPDAPFYRITTKDAKPVLRYAIADVMRADCVRCHNTHPQTPRRDWKVGDVRGVLEVTVPLDAESGLAHAGLYDSFFFIAGLLVAGLFGVGVLVLRLRENNELIERRVVERTKELEAANDRFRAVTQSAHDAIVAGDAEGNVISWNRGAETLFGHREDEILGKPLEILMPESYREPHRRGLRRYLETGEARVIGKTAELQGLTKDGREFPIELSLATWSTAQGTFFSGVIRDITHRKEAEQAQAAALEAAQAANRAKSEFLANMSHEIRTPMNGILGMTEVLLETELAPEQRESMELVKSSAESLMCVINEILDFSKIESGRLELDAAEFDLHELLGNTLKTVALRAHRKGLELTCDIAEDVPERVIGDSTRLRQILVNLIGNALKFTEKGEVVLQARLCEGTADGYRIQFAVIDTGIGIPLEKQAVIFDPFTQADGSTTRRFGGTGLGLTISSRIVALMGGKISIDSEVGRGSTFRFDACFGISQTTDAPKRRRKRLKLKGLAVLVVDDNETNRRVLSGLLRMWDMRPTVVDGAAAAVAELRRALAAGQQYPLMLVDSMMPDVDGFQLVEELRQEPGLAPATIMMLTSADRQNDAARCRSLRMAGYLVKPVQADELQLAIIAALTDAIENGRAVSTNKSQSNGAAGRAAKTASLRILVAEDNPVNQRVALHMLQKAGHSVASAVNGKEALEALARETFDLIFMDVQMPEMDGSEATRRIRAEEARTGKHVPIVAMTAHAMKGDRERCLDAGMDDYVTKPIQKAELMRVLDAFSGDSPGSARMESEIGTDRVFDRATALDHVSGDEEVLPELIHLFLRDTPTHRDEIRDALAREDLKRLERLAHALRGSASCLSAGAVERAADRLEQAGHNGDLSAAKTAVSELEREIDCLTETLSGLVLQS
jgi:two-component system, sensor histidine kinase and response regulator